MSEGLTDIDFKALNFLTLGPDTPGKVTNDEILAAHFVFLGLVQRGLVAKDIGEDGPTYSITFAGRAALTDHGQGEGSDDA